MTYINDLYMLYVLYIVKYIIDSFNGSILLHNNNGLEVILKIPLKK